MIVVVHALLEEYKNELLAEITKFRIENGIQTQMVLIDIHETLENHNKSINENGIQEEIILENIPEMLENPGNLILPENNISLEESRARKYHTKNMAQQFNRVQQYQHKRTYYNSRTRRR
ncbi:MAG: hypothetical protein IKB59_01300 [Alphaproteobacteria bacterium]|nr:hypothetical protein [Alphaproteobacteria bacterium]